MHTSSVESGTRLPPPLTVQSAAVLQLPPDELFQEIVHVGGCAPAWVADKPTAMPPPPPDNERDGQANSTNKNSHEIPLSAVIIHTA